MLFHWSVVSSLEPFLSQQLTTFNHSKVRGGIVCPTSHSMLGFGLDWACTGFLLCSLNGLDPETLLALLLKCHDHRYELQCPALVFEYSTFYSCLQLWLCYLLPHPEIPFSILTCNVFLASQNFPSSFASSLVVSSNLPLLAFTSETSSVRQLRSPDGYINLYV